MWQAPQPGYIKLNVDASILSDKAFIAVIARDCGGSLIKAWTKQAVTLDPAMAEAAAINWALELALAEGFINILVESDAKICVDALLGPLDKCPWKIRTVTEHSLELACLFPSCNFSWGRRDANQMAHALAKVAPSCCLPFSCLFHSLPPSVKEAWSRDLLAL